MAGIEVILDILENKNIVLVGNSVEILNHQKGNHIDSFDVVIRMGKGYPRPHYNKFIGKKMDIWASGFLRAEAHMDRIKVPKLLNRTRIDLNKPREVDGEWVTMFTDEELFEIYDEFGYENNATLGRPSNGFIVLLWLIKKAWVWKSLTLIGFDFFAKSAPFKVGEMHPNSWHLPRNTVSEIPHNVPAEKEYALEMSRNGIIKWEILSDLKEEILED
tara:strand:+ start:3039 stop:3689 length:651 start_codon:yes stop_codon:yes gene_type:complete